jgi:hypothetical protein
MRSNAVVGDVTYVETSRSESESVVVFSARAIDRSRVARSVDVCRPSTSPPAAQRPRRRRREVDGRDHRARGGGGDAIVVVKV